MKNTEEEVLRYPLRVLKWSGQNPEQNKATYFMMVALNIFLGVIVVVTNTLQIIYANGDMTKIVQNWEGLVAVFQVIGKSLITAVKVDDFRKIIKDATQFLSLKTCAEDIQITLGKIFERTLRLEKLYVHIAISVAIGFGVLSCFTKQLPLGVWTMTEYDSLYVCALVFQEFFLLLAAVYTVGYDGLFLSFCIHLRAQFKILHDSLNDLSVSAFFSKSHEQIYFSKLTSHIQHHQFLLRFSKGVRDAYSPVLLIVYTSLLLVYFGEMYVILESKSIWLLLRHSSAMVTEFIQLAFYCIPLNYVTDEAVSISHGVYNSHWYSKHLLNLKTGLPLIIQRSQREIIFRAGGLFVMNCTTLISVIRLSYSWCTIIRALKNV